MWRQLWKLAHGTPAALAVGFKIRLATFARFNSVPAIVTKNRRPIAVGASCLRPQPFCHPGRLRHIAFASLRLQPTPIAFVELFPHEHLGPLSEVDVFPAETDRLADPQSRVEEEFEEETPVVVRQSSEEATQLLAGECFAWSPSISTGMRTPRTGFERSNPSSTAVLNIAERRAKLTQS